MVVVGCSHLVVLVAEAVAKEAMAAAVGLVEEVAGLAVTVG